MKALCFKLRDPQTQHIQKHIIGNISTKTRLQNGLYYPTFTLRTYAKPKNPPLIHKNNTPTLTFIHKKNKPKLQKEAMKRERRAEMRKMESVTEDEDVISQTNYSLRSSTQKLKDLEEQEDILFNKAVLRAHEAVATPQQEEVEEQQHETNNIEEAEKEGQLLEQELQEDEIEDQTDNQTALVTREERRERALAAKHYWLKMMLDKPIVQLVQEKRYEEAESKYMKLSADPTFGTTPQIFNAMLECYGKTKQPHKIHALISANVQKTPLKSQDKPLLPAKPQQNILLDASAYENIIKTLGLSQDLAPMMDYFHEMVNIKKIKPSLMLMNSMIRSYAAADDSVAVEKCFKLLKQSGLTPNVNSYAVVMDHFEKKGDLKLVANYHDLMVKQGLEPTVDIWRTLVKSCRQSFQYDVWNLKQTRGVWHFVKRAYKKKLDYSEAEKRRMQRMLANFKALVQDL